MCSRHTLGRFGADRRRFRRGALTFGKRRRSCLSWVQRESALIVRVRHSRAVTPQTQASPDSRPRRTWLAQLTPVLMGAAGSMLINVVSNDYRYKGVVALFVFCATASAAGWLRKLSPR